MAKALTAAQMRARYEALFEASEHLTLVWTRCQFEHDEGMVMSRWLKDQAHKWLDKAVVAEEALTNGS